MADLLLLGEDRVDIGLLEFAGAIRRLASPAAESLDMVGRNCLTLVITVLIGYSFVGVLCALLGFLGASGHLGVGGPVPAGGPVSGASCAAVACASVSFAASGAFTAACAAVVAGSCASAAWTIK